MTTATARQASDKLTIALLTIASQGLKVHCGQPETHHYWTSEYEAERRLAQLACDGCPVGRPCGEAAEANDERWGVWNGVDRSVRAGKKLQRDSEAA
jgi:Transcription factor WhiB